MKNWKMVLFGLIAMGVGSVVSAGLVSLNARGEARAQTTTNNFDSQISTPFTWLGTSAGVSGQPLTAVFVVTTNKTTGARQLLLLSNQSTGTSGFIRVAGNVKLAAP
jgi:hypothetical protein